MSGFQPSTPRVVDRCKHGCQMNQDVRDGVKRFSQIAAQQPFGEGVFIELLHGGLGSPFEAKEIHGAYVLHSRMASKPRPAWAITLRGLPPIPAKGRFGTSVAAIVCRRNVPGSPSPPPLSPDRSWCKMGFPVSTGGVLRGLEELSGPTGRRRADRHALSRNNRP